MENEKKKSKGKIIAIIVTVITIICISIVAFFIFSNITNNSQDNDIRKETNDNTNKKNNSSTKYAEKQEEKPTLSDSQLKQYIEKWFKARDYENRNTVNKVEKYEEYEKGKYIYLVYYYDKGNEYTEMGNWIDILLIDTTYSINNPKMAWGAGVTADLFSNEKIKEVKEEIEKNNINWKDYDKTVDSTANGTTNSTTSQNNYQDDTVLKVLAFDKWLKEDSYIKLLYEENGGVYTGTITKNSDGSVSVYLKLYDKENYKLCEENLGTAFAQANAASYGSTTIKLTKEEATK